MFTVAAGRCTDKNKYPRGSLFPFFISFIHQNKETLDPSPIDRSPHKEPNLSFFL